MRGLALTTAQYSLLKVDDKDLHPKNWRPQLMICLSSQWSKHSIDVRAISLLNLAGQLKVLFPLIYPQKRYIQAGRGLAISVAFVKGYTDNTADRERAKEIKARVHKDMTVARLRGFAKTLFFQHDQVPSPLVNFILLSRLWAAFLASSNRWGSAASAQIPFSSTGRI